MKSFAATIAPALVALTATAAFAPAAFAHSDISSCRVIPHEHSNKAHRPGGSHVHGWNGANQRHTHGQTRSAPNGGWTTHPRGFWQEGPTNSAPPSAYSGTCVRLQHNH